MIPPLLPARIMQRTCCIGLIVLVVVGVKLDGAHAQQSNAQPNLGQEYQATIRPLLQRFCFDCHAEDVTEADVDLSAFLTIAEAQGDTEVWQKVGQMLDSRQMPPQESLQPSAEEFEKLNRWVRDFLTSEAETRAGDPGPVVLRRLSNAEYTYTLQDLTGISELDPAREFPVDGAAGEGFTNTGSALVMSPALVTKYLDAGKQVAEHLVLLPEGVRFSRYSTRRDWTNEQLDRIREFYARFSDDRGGTAVNLQGIQFDTNTGGRLPFDEYLKATLEERRALLAGKTDLASVAQQRRLNIKYLTRLWQVLIDDKKADSILIEELQRRWIQADVDQLPALSAFVQQWQTALWKFNAIGQIGREGGPPSWQEPMAPLTSRQDFRIPLPETASDQEIVVRLAVSDAGDGNVHDVVIWENARLERAGLPTVALRDAKGLQVKLDELRRTALAHTSRYLKVVSGMKGDVDVEAIARAERLDPAVLNAWLRLLDVSTRGPVDLTGHFTEKLDRAGDYDFIQGWGSPQTPSFNANSSDQEVRIPGIARPHRVFVHPSPTLFVAAGWRSPITGIVNVQAKVADAHPECGNGVEWMLLHRFGNDFNLLASGRIEMGGSEQAKPQTVSVRQGDVLSLVIGPKDGNHSCDLTELSFSIKEAQGAQRVWNLAGDVSDDILAGNPHEDSYGNPGIWHFYQGEMAALEATSEPTKVAPPGSLLAQWQEAEDVERRLELAEEIQQLLLGEAPADPSAPNAMLFRYVHQMMTPSYDADLLASVNKDERFGERDGTAAGELDIVMRAPEVLEFRLPGELASKAELVVSGYLDPNQGLEGSVQLHVVVDSEPNLKLSPQQPIIVAERSATRDRVVQALDDFRQLFPIALCYKQIVPVDEVVTLQLFYREDDLLQQLMLDEQQSAMLDRMWDELFYLSQEPIALTVAFEQLSEFATQDRPDIVVALEPLRKPINERADRFRARMVADEPNQLEAVIQLAERAWRRELATDDREKLDALYRELRDAELSHDASLRLTLARILTSPDFLYRLESPAEGTNSAPVSNTELANRLSYFLWSTMPDDELMDVATAGELTEDDTLREQTTRMLTDAKARRMAIHFACQWLGVRDFDQHDEKNEKLYPDFVDLREAMYEETVRFFEDMIRHDGSVLDLLDADHTFVNGKLAKYYDIPNIDGNGWQRVEGIQEQGRGGVLGMATILSKQSGASRTSPILRGNWVYETLLGQRLPRPPANVPQLPERLPQGLTSRQLIEQHSSFPECAKCHERIDPFGFALEQFDAVGRLRSEEVDTKARLLEGQEIDGLEGLRHYLLNERRDEVVRQFCRKLLGYALGRGVQLSDEPLLKEMQQQLQANEYRFSEAVKVIVLSRQFREIRGRDVAIE